MDQQFIVREFGKSVLNVFTHAESDVQEETERLVIEDFKKAEETLQYIRDFRWVQEMKIIDGPQTDKLNRFRPVGWYALGGSVGYDKLKEYFACNRQHVPEEITMDFINKIIHAYTRQEAEKLSIGYPYERDDLW